MRRPRFLGINPVLFLVLLAISLAAVQPARAGERREFLLKIQLVDKDPLHPVEEFANLEFQLGNRIASAINSSLRTLHIYLLQGKEYTISVKAIAPDGRIAYDQRTFTYVFDEDPVPDGIHDLVFVLDFGPPPEEQFWDDLFPTSDPPDAGPGDEPEENPWTESVEEASSGEKEFPGFEESEGEVVVPPEALDQIRARQPGEIPPGERRIILSGFELAQGEVDDRSSPAVIDPLHVVIAVQYPNGESRVLDGEEAILVMRERGFLEADGLTLTAAGRRGWESPYVAAADGAPAENPGVPAATGQDVALDPPASTGPTLLEQITVPARGGPVSSATTFAAGQYYLFEVSGVITAKFYSNKGNHLTTDLHDPIYTISTEVHHDPSRSSHPGPDDFRFVESHLRIDDDVKISDSLGCYLDGGWRLKALFDHYRTDHVYRFKFEGTGRPLSFYYYWHDDYYARCEGSFTIKIYTWSEEDQGGDAGSERRPS